MRLAIVHDWLVTSAGAELVLRELRAVWPGADVFSLVDFLSPETRASLNLGAVHTSRIQRFPGARRHYRKFLPFMPGAIEALDLSSYDLVLSNSHAVAKGVRTTASQLHICLCLTPIRYAWDLREQYLSEAGMAGGITGWTVNRILDRIQRWDTRNSRNVDSFIAISRYIADRITRCYGRDSTVVYPPVDTEFFVPSPAGPPRRVYVTASRFVPYKRVDLIAAAFSRDGSRQLVIIGDGPDAAKIERAAGPNVMLAGRLPREAVREHLRRARAFVFAAEEDFGIAPLEAQASGTPVIAFGKGGAAETIIGLDQVQPTGVFFEEQSADSLIGALERFEREEGRITPEACRRNAERFSVSRFQREIRGAVEGEWSAFEARGRTRTAPAFA